MYLCFLCFFGTVKSEVSDSSKIEIELPKPWNAFKLNLKKADFLYNSGVELLDEYMLDEAKEKFHQALTIYSTERRFESIGNCYLNLGYVADMNSDFYTAIDYYSLAVDNFKKIAYKEGLADAYNNIGIMHCLLYQYDKGLDYYLLSLEIEEELNNEEGISYSLGNIGLVYRKIGNIEKAIEYYYKSVEIKERIQDKHGLAITYCNLGSLYMNLDSVDKAINLFRFSYDLHLNNDDLEGQAYSLHNIGDAMVHKGNYAEGAEVLNDALSIRINLGDEKGKMSTYYSLAEAYYGLGNYTLFKQNIDLSNNLATQLKQQDKLLQIMFLYYEYYKSVGNVNVAIKYLEDYLDLKNQIDEDLRAQQILETQARFDTEKKESEIEEMDVEITNLIQEKEIQKLKIANDRLLKIFLGISVILVLVITYFIYKRYILRSRLNAILEEKNAELEESNRTKNKFFSIISHDLSNYAALLESLSGMIERKYQLMDARKLSEALTTLNSTAIRNKELIKNLLNWAIAQSRKIKLYPEQHNASLFVENVVNSLKQIAENKGIVIQTDLKSNIFFFADKNTIDTVLRNLISNAIKFSSNNSTIVIKTKSEKDKTIFSVKDYGLGMSKVDLDKLFRTDIDPKSIGDNVNKGTGFGLILCKEFIEMNNGEISVESELGKGANFIFKLPVESN